MRGLVIVAAVALLAQPALAQGGLPEGSYLDSCRGAEVTPLLGGSGQLLTAFCRSVDGTYAQSRLNIPCSGDIANRNGRLVCRGGGGGGGGGGNDPFAPPPGSYQSVCRKAHMTGPILHARCPDRNGDRQETTLNVLNCRGRDIGVDRRGRLNCN